jgi:hypothetical protein
MKRRRLLQAILGCMVVSWLPTACLKTGAAPTPSTTAIQAPIPTPTFTPDPCTGWWCTITGVVYDETIGLGNEAVGAKVTLHQGSYCSPTRGEQQTTTDLYGTFEFSDVFFHDTDRIRIQIESGGHETAHWDSVDFSCLYCSCFETHIEIVLHTAAGP